MKTAEVRARRVLWGGSLVVAAVALGGGLLVTQLPPGIRTRGGSQDKGAGLARQASFSSIID